MNPKVSIIISNRNDTVMLCITIRSCIEELRFLPPSQKEIIVVDNSDEKVYKQLSHVLPTGYIRDRFLKIYRQPSPCLFTARELAAQKATGDLIICLDSHMLVGRGTFEDLVRFKIERTSDQTIGFLHAPISWAHQHEQSAKHDRDMSVNELGDWGSAYKTPRTITWKGMPWLCDRKWFLNELNAYGALAQHNISWGGGDMHIGIKPWILGYKNWAVPTSPCIHIGPFPHIDVKSNPNLTKTAPDSSYRYRLYGASGNYPSTIGFLISCYVLGGEPMMERNAPALKERFGNLMDPQKWWSKAMELGQDEKDWIDARKKMTFEQLIERKPWDS
jgi:glycosyltransferase involved in cell wall biosynthesis